MDKDLFLNWLEEKSYALTCDIEVGKYSSTDESKGFGKGVLFVFDELLKQVKSGKFDKITTMEKGEFKGLVKDLTEKEIIESYNKKMDLIEDLIFSLATIYTQEAGSGICNLNEDLASSKYASGLNCAMNSALDLKRELESTKANVSGDIRRQSVRLRGILLGLGVIYTEKDENGISKMYSDIANSKYAGSLKVAMNCALELEKVLKGEC